MATGTLMEAAGNGSAQVLPGSGETPAVINIWSGFPDKANAGIYDQEQDNRFKPQPNWLEIVDISEAEAPKVYDWENEDGFPNEPAQEATWESLRERTRDIMVEADKVLDEKTIDSLSLVQTAIYKIRNAGSKTADFFGNKERDQFRKRLATGVVIGALAVAGGVTGLEQGGGSDTALHRDVEAGLASPAKPRQHLHEHVQRLAATTLPDGGNPWTVSEHQLETHGVADPTDTQVLSYDRRLLRMNHIGPSKAKRLLAGMKLLLPKIR